MSSLNHHLYSFRHLTCIPLSDEDDSFWLNAREPAKGEPYDYREPNATLTPPQACRSPNRNLLSTDQSVNRVSSLGHPKSLVANPTCAPSLDDEDSVFLDAREPVKGESPGHGGIGETNPPPGMPKPKPKPTVHRPEREPGELLSPYSALFFRGLNPLIDDEPFWLNVREPFKGKSPNRRG